VRCRPGDVIMRVDPRYFRPTEAETLLRDATRARERLGWRPATGFGGLVREVTAADFDLARATRSCAEPVFLRLTSVNRLQQVDSSRAIVRAHRTRLPPPTAALRSTVPAS